MCSGATLLAFLTYLAMGEVEGSEAVEVAEVD